MRRVCSVLIVFIMSFSLCSCGTPKIKKKDFYLQEINGFKITDELSLVKIDTGDYDEFVTSIDYDGINCPYSDLFGIDAALSEKSSRIFDVSEHTYDFFAGASSVDAEKLYNVVKKNNKKYMDGVGKHFNKELSNSKLKECCEIVTDTLNWGIENIEGIDLLELGCILGNLKILKRNTMSLGTYNDKTGLLNISPDMIKSKKDRNGNSNMYELTVSHEAMHILQCRCSDVEQSDEDHFIGTSYSFENLEINPLKHRWLYEASAELNATLFHKSKPTTYEYMIDNLETISLVTVLDDSVKARQLEKLSFTQNEDELYQQLGFADKKKAIEFLYSVELLREKPEEFKIQYENLYGTVKEFDEFLKITYNPYFIEVMSKLLYKNLAYQLSKREICLNDVFYIISLYELDLMKDIPFNMSNVREKYQSAYKNYIELQSVFFDILQTNTDIDIHEEFERYKINYLEDETYSNGSFEWLDEDKRNYLLFRNRVLYNQNHLPMISFQNAN